MTAVLPETPAVDRDGVPHYRLFIDGVWVDTDTSIPVVDPATEETVVTVAVAATEHVDAAVAAAERVHESGIWRNTPPAERAAVIDRVIAAVSMRMDELAVLSAKETGMPLRVAGAIGVGFPLVHMGHYAQLTRTYEWERSGPVTGQVLSASFIRKEPVGVCAGIVPWNFPALIAVWKSIPALAAGNTVVLKTDEKTPIFALELGALLRDAGLPDGAYNVVVGDGPNIGGRLVEHPDVRLVSFTGSTATGRQVMAAAASNVKRVVLELGGKGPNIVLDDADLDAAVDGSIYAFLLHAGQACESGTRLLLPSAIHDRFVARLVKRLRTLKQGDPLDPATDIGAVMNKAQRDRILGYIEKGKAEGATVVVGGGVPTGPEFEKGFWVEPTVFTGVTNDMAIAREEIFGPVLAVLKYDSTEEAIKIANDTEYGLSAAVWSRDNQRALDIARQLEAGSVWINDFHNISQYLPFGGFKQSGTGRELGPDALDEFTQDKGITVDLSGDVSRRAYGLVLGTPPSAE
ncbi:aldehyde dehydrogenase family protein [Nocardia sp. alder85J]|uniref:aldehyde dehydrogenase family protein n=1 Tax=Nocardia sp. alder85J TaxID=2862949 RepID=UPI001CD199C5|nr:aldehyde dehydrogenase family protein [Nocardia sp. alder85J]MCX4095592.1 aldehyde dehydrogenase family protein [Nocardia sp. alder85J]